jgi:poly(A) polymerase
VHIFFSGGKNIEVATFRDTSDDFVAETEEESLDRSEKTSDQNRFGTESTDAFRRDLTINGLYYDVTRSRIIDYVGGFQDLQNGIIRVIGNPVERYQEDPVRMMRVVRHAARCGFTIEESTRKAIDSEILLLLEAAPMRVFEELRKDLLSGYSAPTLHLFEETGLLKLLFPDLAHPEYFRLRHPFSVGLRRLDVLCRESRAPSLAAVLSFCALHSLGKSQSEAVTAFGRQDSLLAHLRNTFVQLSVPRKERERVSAVLQLWSQIEKTPLEKRSPQKIFRRSCFPDLCDFVSLVDGPESETPLSQLLHNALRLLGEEGGAEREDDERRPRRPTRKRRPSGSPSKRRSP